MVCLVFGVNGFIFRLFGFVFMEFQDVKNIFHIFVKPLILAFITIVSLISGVLDILPLGYLSSILFGYFLMKQLEESRERYDKIYKSE